MKLFIWERLDKVSNNWHTGGGLVVVAQDLDAAKAKAAEYSDDIVIDQEPDYEYTVSDGSPELVAVFPDAGCC